jgi:hypothetical protein
LGVTEGVGDRFQVLRTRTHFWRYRGRQVPFSCFALPASFWALPRVSGLVFMFCARGHIFGGTEGVRSRFHVLSSPPLFGRYRGRRGSFSSYALPDTFLAVPLALGPVFMFCAPGLHWGVIEGAGSRFHFFCSRIHFGGYRGRRVLFPCFALPDSFRALSRASGLVFMFCAPENVFGGTEGVGSRFHVLRSRTRFCR